MSTDDATEGSRGESASFAAQEMLITEHLMFAPLSLIDDIINTVNELIYKAMSGLEKYLNELPQSSITSEELETGMHKLETLLENAVDRNFDGFELYVLRNVTHIPEDLVPYVRLKHQEGIDFNNTAELAEVEEELAKARRAYAASKRVNRLLRLEQRLNDRKLALLDKHADRVAFLETEARKHGIDSVKDSLAFLEEQMRGLQSNLDAAAKLEPVLNLGLEQDDRSRFIQSVLLKTVLPGATAPGSLSEADFAEMQKIGKLEDLEKAAAILGDYDEQET